MYSTKLINKNYVDKNAYITVGDPYKTPAMNPFRAGKKGEHLKTFNIKVSLDFWCHYYVELFGIVTDDSTK